MIRDMGYEMEVTFPLPMFGIYFSEGWKVGINADALMA
jgi:hypothetical protein